MISSFTKKYAALAAAFIIAAIAQAGADYDLPAVGGYDLVSYHEDTGPVRGTGFHASSHEGVTYLFASKENKKAFEKSPEKYLPAYNGYCAFGVSLGKKFNSDPSVYEIVDGTLYLNLDKGIQGKWSKDIPGNIEKADGNWSKIADTPASKL